MKLNLTKSELLKPLAKAAGASSGARSKLPILGCVLLQVQGESLCITGTDLEVTITARLPCEADGAGAFCLPADKLLAVVRGFESEAITITVDGDKATIASGRSRLRLPVQPASEFPATDMPQGARVELPTADLAAVIAHVRPAMAKNDVRYYLNGMLLESGGGQLRAVATDGHRMGAATMEAGGEWNIIVPGRAVEELADLVAKGPKTLHLTADASHIAAVGGNLTLVSKLVLGRYPDWRRVLPGEGQVVTVAGSRLRAALERAAVVAIKGGVRLTVGGGRIGIESGAGDELIDDAVDADTGDADLVLGANLSYLVDALKVASSEHVEIVMSSPDKAVVVRPAGGADRFTVIMPMRL